MGLFRRDLPRLKGLDQVAAQVCSLVDGMAAGPGKFDIRSFGGTAIGRNKQLSVRLFRVADIVNLLLSQKNKQPHTVVHDCYVKSSERIFAT